MNFTKNIPTKNLLSSTLFRVKNIEKIKIFWLSTLIFLALCTIGLGAYTRLSGSGLSMVEWKVIKGIFPPWNHAQWMKSFDLYKNFPEYQLIKNNMTLKDYQFIYLVEYSHRILGRLIGLSTVIPFLFFIYIKKLSKSEIIHGTLIIVLIAAQGGMGWYMVKSGLVDIPQVSHYRLTAHFFLALIFINYCTMLMLNLKGAFRGDFQKAFHQKTKDSSRISILTPILFLLTIQTILGTFTAGLDAGLVSKDYPKMFGQWIPWEQLFSQNINIWKNFIQNTSTIHFFHRHLGVILAIIIIAFCIKKLIQSKNYAEKLPYIITLIICLIQPILGIITIVTQVNSFFAIFHQLVAVVLYQCMVFLWLSDKIAQIKKNPPQIILHKNKKSR